MKTEKYLFKTHLYVGGLFEWLCLQDIYGQSEFPTTNIELDITEFGIDPEKEGWNTIYLKKIKWKSDECQLSRIKAEKMKHNKTNNLP